MTRFLVLFCLSVGLNAQILSPIMFGVDPDVKTPVDTNSGGSCTGSSGAWTCTGTTTVSFTDASADFIRYTNDGSTTPTFTTGTLFTTGVSTASNTTYKAIGCKVQNRKCGGVLTSVYTISGGATLLSHTLAQSTTNDGAGPSAAIDTTGATLLFAFQSYYDITACTAQVAMQDSQSNAWIPLSAATSTGTAGIIGFYVLAPITSSSHTFTAYAGGSCYPAITVQAWNTVTHFDQATQGGTNGTNSCQPGIGNVTPAHPNSVVIAGMAASTLGYTPPPSINQGFALGDYNVGAGTAVGGAIASIVQTTATAVNPTFSLSGGGAMTCAIAIFY